MADCAQQVYFYFKICLEIIKITVTNISLKNYFYILSIKSFKKHLIISFIKTKKFATNSNLRIRFFNLKYKLFFFVLSFLTRQINKEI